MRTNTSQPQGAGKIFRKTARLDLVRPSRPRKHLCTCNVTTPRRDGKTAKMEVNELLGRFEKVKNSTPCYYGLGLPILNEMLGKAHKKSLAPKKRGIYIYGYVIAGKSALLSGNELSGGNFIFAQFPIRVFQVDVFASYYGQTFVWLAENVAVLLAVFGISPYCIFKNRGFHKIKV